MLRTSRIALALFVFAISISVTVAQQPMPGSIRGTVVQAGTTTPIANTRVELFAANGAAPVIDHITTDATGIFFFPAVAAGQYRLVGTRAGYAKAEYGQRRPNDPGLTLTVAAGQRADNVLLNMTQGGTITGRVTDNGKPVGIADVIAMKLVDNDGQASPVIVLSSRTDDLGNYQIFWLPPGQYYIVVQIYDVAGTSLPIYINPDGDNGTSLAQTRGRGRAVLNRAVGAGAGDNEMHAPTYYPGTVYPDKAVLVDVRPGAELSGIDINAPAIPTQHIRGTISGTPMDTNGKPVVRPTIAMIPLNAASLIGGVTSTLADLSGTTFDVPKVASGSYNMVVTAGALRGVVPIEVRNSDIDGVRVGLEPGSGFSINGHIVIERQPAVTPDPEMSPLRVVLRTDITTLGSTRYLASPPAADGTFRIPAGTAAPGLPLPPPVLPGDYRVLIDPVLVSRTDPTAPNAPVPVSLQNAYVKSIRLGDRDVLNDGLHLTATPQDRLEIVIGTNPGSVEGRVMNARQQPASAVWVVLIPENKLRFRADHRYVSTDAEGKFHIEGIPPGDYKVFAWEDIEKLAWQEPVLMRPYESLGAPVHVDEGRKTTIDVQSIPARN